MLIKVTLSALLAVCVFPFIYCYLWALLVASLSFCFLCVEFYQKELGLFVCFWFYFGWLFVQSHLEHFSHLVLGAAAAGERYICICALAMRQLSLRRAISEISPWPAHHHHHDHRHLGDFYEGIRIKNVYCVYLLRTRIKNQESRIENGQNGSIHTYKVDLMDF